MHKSGIVAACLLVVAACVAAVFTSKVVQIRNSYTSKNLVSKNKYIEMQPKIDVLEKDIDRKKADIFRARELWGEFWPNVQTSVNPGDGTIQINIGANNLVRDKMVMYGFEPVEGGVIYRGSFSVAAVNDAGATLKPNWRATPQDTSTWKSGPWRWRNEIPSGFQDIADNQLLTIVKHEETLKVRQSALNSQKDLLTAATNTLKVREAELVGGEGMSKSQSVEAEFRNGLVAANEQVEEDRNLTLRKIDELRRQVRNTQADIERLNTENGELAARLPEPAANSQVTQKK